MTNEKCPPGDGSQQPALNDNLMERVLSPENLHAAWKQVKGNKGAPGVDGLSVEDYPQWARTHWAATHRALEVGYYIPQPVKHVEIPKPGGGSRSLDIPSVNDRVIQQAIAQVLNPIIDPGFSESSHGFRPRRNAHGAVRQVKGFIEAGYKVAVDVDLSKFFDRVNHDVLMSRLVRYITDKRLLRLIGRYLRAGMEFEGGEPSTHEKVPQGGPLSPLLSGPVRLMENKSIPVSRLALEFLLCVSYGSPCSMD